METKTLDDKLAAFVGWKFLKIDNAQYIVRLEEGHVPVPSFLFTESYDMCFMLLVPKLVELWGERVSVNFRHYEKEALRLIEKPWHCTLARWMKDVPGYEPGYNGFVLQHGGFGDTHAEAFCNAFEKVIPSGVVQNAQTS